MLRWIRALVIMLNAHKGQKDKAGKPYFWHPLRVSFYSKGMDAKVVALLHDVLEDCLRYKAEDFSFLKPCQLEALKVITKPVDVEYFDYIDKIKNNPIATEVKSKDLLDNMNLGRLQSTSAKDLERLDKYYIAYKMLRRSLI